MYRFTYFVVYTTQPDAHYRLARIYNSLGEKKKAEAEFAKTLELHQKDDAAAALQLKMPSPASP